MTKSNSNHKNREDLLEIFERANQIASMTSLDELLSKMLYLILEVAEAESGTLYLHDPETKELVFHAIQGGGSQDLIGRRMNEDEGIVGTAFTHNKHVLVEDLQQDERWVKIKADDTDALELKQTLAIPLLVGGHAIGVVQIFNFDKPEIEVLMLLASRMASEVDKLSMITASQQYTQRLETLFEVVRGLGSTLDREQLLHHIVVQGSHLLDTEACSIFLIDEKTERVELYTAADKIEISVPKDKGIVGEVIRTGKSLIVHDAQNNPLFYSDADEETKFVTRDILAAPLNSAPIHLGEGRGSAKERTMGVIEALNKKNPPFNQKDLEILESLAIQAATVLRIAELYTDATELFLDLVEALSSTIDAKDPYTRFHSKHVAAYAQAIGREIGLDQDILNHYYVGGMLHDLGKIGIPITVLNKPGKLSEEEYELIKEHPIIGSKILETVEQLIIETQGAHEHHESYDGKGYPQGLSGEDISLIGRVICVADVFDALTTDRPYRDALSHQEAIAHLKEFSGIKYDPVCVEAMIALEAKGEIPASETDYKKA